MQLLLNPGTYVLAASGGVDSMVLLDLLRKRPGVNLVVAHYDHGIRKDSELDRQLVQRVSKEHKLPFVYHNGQLGPYTSEAAARHARYAFLRQARTAAGAKAIITAHHQDDLLETAILNLLRGTGRRGLTSLKSTDGIIRPLLSHPKDRLRDYAADHKLAWREDPSNKDMRYKRNYVRHQLIPKLTPGERAQFLILLDKLATVNDEIDSLLINQLHAQPASGVIDRHWFIGLPHQVSTEVTRQWLDRHRIRDISRKRIEKLVVTMKTGRANTKHDLDKVHKLKVNKTTLALDPPDR